MKSPNRLSVVDAAELMGLQRNVFPFGYAVKRERRWSYYISPMKFTEYTGIEVPDALNGEAI